MSSFALTTKSSTSHIILVVTDAFATWHSVHLQQLLVWLFCSGKFPKIGAKLRYDIRMRTITETTFILITENNSTTQKYNFLKFRN